jgi:hypothetical protein
MAKLKLKKYPKKPKKSASNQTLENYLQRVKEVDAYNAKIRQEQKKREQLLNKISGIGRAK